MRFINTNKTSQIATNVSTLSDTISFISGGVAKGNAVDSFSWIADFLFKNPDNTNINSHVGYISFFSDKEIMYQEFGNVSDINTNYPFFTEIVRQRLSPDSFELTRKQYTSVSNKKADFDSIEYVNISDQIKIAYVISNPETTTTTPNPNVNNTGYLNYNHGYWRAPPVCIFGYKLHLDNLETNPVPNFDKYFFSYTWELDVQTELKKSIINVGEFVASFSYPNNATHEINSLMPTAFTEVNEDIRKIVDIKFNIANPKYFYFENLDEWVCYYNDTLHYYEQSYAPYYGFVNYYYTNEDNGIWESMFPTNDVLFFPAIIRNSTLEPAKIISRWYQTANKRSGQMSFNNGIHLNQSDDQSRIVYNASYVMVNEYGSVSKQLDGINLYGGIDVDTERNRRYSSVVMTEPYFVTEPICGGEIISYSFVDKDGKYVVGSGLNPDNCYIFLKIKASKSVIDELDRLLKQQDYNTDIIETIAVNDAMIKRFVFNSDSEYYKNFYQLFYRQDDCIDDLIGTSVNKGVVGEGHHLLVTIPNFNSNTKYSDTKNVNGLGYVAKTIVDSNGVITGVTSILNAYCSNYVPKNCPDKTGADIGNVAVSLFNGDDVSSISNVYNNELFRPMIKLPGINGYIKIIEKNIHFKTTRSNDGMYEVVYNVEFPFCPGSYSKRMNMNFTSTNPYNETVILNKVSYINAESWSNGSNNRYGINNDRYTPFLDDSFCPFNMLTQYASTGTVPTNNFSNGGGIDNLLSSKNNVVNYPSDLVWKIEKFKLLSLLKPATFQDYKRYGTFDVQLNIDHHLSGFSEDVKLVGLVDNRQWNFSQDKYISYINKENPSYVCEIDLSTLFKNFTDLQALNAAMPDIKRWLYGYFSGFASTIQNVDTTISDRDTGYDSEWITEKVNTIENKEITTNNSKSDIIIEMWDKSLSVPNWRPVSFNSNDSAKATGRLLIDQVNISDSESDADDGLKQVVGNIYTAAIGYINYQPGVSATFNFPDFVNFGKSNDLLYGKSNLVLYYNNNGKPRTYHVIYIDRNSTGDARQLYRAFIYYDPTYELPLTDPANWSESDRGLLGIYEPKKEINIDISFEIYTNQVVQEVVDNIITRFIDIKTNDSSRYIDDNKLYFRVRVSKAKNYSVSCENQDTSIIQLKGSDIITSETRLYMNFPWYHKTPTPGFDTEFKWEKIETTEIIKKFGMSYFKCASK